MIDFGWTRLAYLLAVLSVLGALAQLGSPSAEPRPLASERPERQRVDAGSPTTTEPHSRASAGRRENRAAPAFAGHLKRALAGAPDAASPGTGRAIFHRPAPGSAGGTGSGPVCGDLGGLPGGDRLVFPLPMQHANSYEDTWGAPRPQGGHEGTDLMVPPGTPEYAVTDGTVVPVTGSNGNGWNSLGGYAVMLRAAYSVGPVKEGDLFYYAHLQRESSLPLGAAVRAGQLVGYAGDTGQGPEVTRGLFPPHLHFGWYDATGERSYLPSGAMDPYPLLEWLRAGGGVLGGGSGASYCEILRSGAPTPSTGANRWPDARDAGAGPDLDTGTRRPAPTTTAGKARSPEPQTGRAANPASAETSPAGPRDALAKSAPDREAGAAGPVASRDAASEPDRHRPATGQDPVEDRGSPVSTPENKSVAEQESGPPGEEHDLGGSDGAQKNPSGSAEEPEAEEPEAEESEGDRGRPDEGTAPGEGEVTSVAGEDLETAPQEAGGAEDPPPETVAGATSPG